MEGVVRLVAHRTRAAVRGARPGPAAAGRGAGRTPPSGWRAAIGAAPLAPVLAAAAQNRRPMSLPGLGAEPGTVAVAPIMVNHDVVAHLVDGARRRRSGAGAGAGRRPEPAAHRARGHHLRDHPGPRAGGRRGRGAGPHRAGRGPAAGPRPRRRRGRALGRPPRLPARRRAPRVRGGRARTSPAAPGPAGRPPADAGARPSGPSCAAIPDAIVAVRETEVVAVALVPPGSRAGLDGVRTLAQQCRAAIVERYPEVTVVAGDRRLLPAAGGDLPVLRARRAGPSTPRPGWAPRPAVVAYDDLGIHRLLLQVPDLGELRSFATAVLGDLVRDRAGPSCCRPCRPGSGPAAARSAPPARCTCTPTPSATGSGGSRRSPACGWTTTRTG